MTFASAPDIGIERFALRLADDALVLSQQLGHWVTRAPQIEEELAIANITLDLLGQARILLSRAGDEDQLAFERNSSEYCNLLLVEQPNGDFAQTIVRQLLFSTFQLARYEVLQAHPDEAIAGVAGRGVKEVAYHREHAVAWTLRLGDGTAESRARMLNALQQLWPFTQEMFLGDDVDDRCGFNPSMLQQDWNDFIDDVLERASLAVPQDTLAQKVGGRQGDHTAYLAALLDEMQALYRSHPGASW